jgi:hypothetical protein
MDEQKKVRAGSDNRRQSGTNTLAPAAETLMMRNAVTSVP